MDLVDDRSENVIKNIDDWEEVTIIVKFKGKEVEVPFIEFVDTLPYYGIGH